MDNYITSPYTLLGILVSKQRFGKGEPINIVVDIYEKGSNDHLLSGTFKDLTVVGRGKDKIIEFEDGNSMELTYMTAIRIDGEWFNVNFK